MDRTHQRGYITLKDIASAEEYDFKIHFAYEHILQHCSPSQVWIIKQKINTYYQRRSHLYHLLSVKYMASLNGLQQQPSWF